MSMRLSNGNLKPDLIVELSNEGKNPPPVDLDDAIDIRVIGRLVSDEGELLNVVFERVPDTHEVLPDGTSTVTLLWVAGETDTDGRIRVEVKVWWPGLKPQTFRTDARDTANVVPELAA